jgi:uncharacterized protein (DUF488 family)
MFETDSKNHRKSIYTIGYSVHSADSFIDILRKHNISAVADVRSQPYSQFKPEFNREKLKLILKQSEMAYVFLGNYIGARIDAPECYKNGKADYQLIAKHPFFRQGLERIRSGMQKYNIALMCAEKDPVNCHRAILICRYLRDNYVEIKHIIDSALETHSDTEKRLMKMFKLDQPDLFKTERERLEESYNRQGEKIAFKKDEGDEAD